MADKKGPTIIIKRPRAGGGGHHGGAWKIAYADFVTAMMAFFLLLWLMASTTEEQRRGISDFFSAVPFSGGQGASGILQGKVLDVESSINASRAPSSNDPSIILPTPGASALLDQIEPQDPTRTGESPAAVSEREAFDEIQDQLRSALKGLPELASSLVIERTAEGLRIQLVDQERAPMFASGSAAMAPRLDQLLKLVASMVADLPNAIAVGGHTDAHPFARENYSNWELSADRANAARRTLVGYGVPEHRFARVLGLADRQPLIADRPLAAGNRRISVLVMSNLAPKAG